jgi:hypothetical protein
MALVLKKKNKTVFLFVLFWECLCFYSENDSKIY